MIKKWNDMRRRGDRQSRASFDLRPIGLQARPGQTHLVHQDMRGREHLFDPAKLAIHQSFTLVLQSYTEPTSYINRARWSVVQGASWRIHSSL
jgi:hypothetical protein